jgi:pyruvate dehydrogenase E2 component (dihydrolipoamide acetyltransferase)
MSEAGARRSTQAGEGTLVVQTRLQSAVARQMAASKREIPHFYVSADVVMDHASAELRQLSGRPESGLRITMSALLIQSLAQTLREHPAFNCLATEDGFVVVDSVNIGVAIALDSGLIAPALLDADRMSVVEVAGALDDLVTRSRAGKLRSAELLGPTFTLSNLGMFGVSAFAAIIPPPQVGILAVGRSIARPVVVEGSMVIREVMTATLAADHRAVDGAQAARFLTAFKNRLESFQAKD